MIRFILSVFLVFVISSLRAQGTSLKPILVDKSVLSGVGLKKVVLEKEPEKDFFQKRLFRGTDISVYVVSTETWNNQFTNFWFDEFVYMYHGEAIVKPEEGVTQLFYSGDYFFAPKGFTGEWELRAGTNLHYELSVITTKRTDSTVVSKDLKHQLFNKSILSGAHIEFDKNGFYEETLKQGVELTITLHAEKPNTRELVPQKEKLIQILSGTLSLIDKLGEQHEFYTGDFLIIPHGFLGSWHSNGHGLIKYLTIEKTGN